LLTIILDRHAGCRPRLRYPLAHLLLTSLKNAMDANRVEVVRLLITAGVDPRAEYRWLPFKFSELTTADCSPDILRLLPYPVS